MKKSLIVAGALSLALAPTIALAEAPVPTSQPVELTAIQMDSISAGSLELPNGNLVFENFDNPAPDEEGYLGELTGFCDPEVSGAFCHPALNRRSDTALGATLGHGPSVGGFNDGPWAATVASPVITCPDC